VTFWWNPDKELKVLNSSKHSSPRGTTICVESGQGIESRYLILHNRLSIRQWNPDKELKVHGLFHFHQHFSASVESGQGIESILLIYAAMRLVEWNPDKELKG